MPDERRHRGPHPQDGELFAESFVPDLRRAVADNSWLLSRGYAHVSALKVVGDRYGLTVRQRIAVMRCSATDEAVENRTRKQCDVSALRGAVLEIDGFNILTTFEAALAGGVLIRGRDGCLRDLASMHGTWRRVTETRPAVELVGGLLESCGPAECRWFLDAPVSNSGRLAETLREVAAERSWPWTVETIASPDARLSAATGEVVAITADSAILDRCACWHPIAAAIPRCCPNAWILDLG